MIGKTTSRQIIHCSFTLFWGLSFSQLLHAVDNMPPPAPFIRVENANEHPLGSAYVVPYDDTQTRVRRHNIDTKRPVLSHREGEAHPLPIVREAIQGASYPYFGLRDRALAPNEVLQVQGGNAPDNILPEPRLGDFIFQTEAAEHEHELVLDVCQLYTPYKDCIDPTRTRLINLHRFERIDEESRSKGAPLKYKCVYIRPNGREKSYNGDTLENTCRPATTHKELILKLCGTHLVTQHYFGAYYQRTLKFTLRSAAARQQLRARVALGPINLDANLLATLSTTEINWRQEVRQQSFLRLLNFLRTQGHEALVTAFETQEDRMITAPNITAAFSAARALHQVLVQLNRVLERMQYDNVDFSTVLSVIAMRPESHGRACHAQEAVSILDLEKATAHAWRACAEKLSNTEQRKAKKVDKGIL